MADAYKGLTIKLGGDATELNKALKSAKQAASDVQYQLKQVNRALSFDAGDLTTINQKLELLGDASGDWQKQLNLDEQAIEKLTNTVVELDDGKTTIGELADATSNAALAAKTALSNYNEVDAAIASCYNEVAKFSKQVGITAEDLRDMTPDELYETLDMLTSMGVITEELAQKVKNVKKLWVEADNALDAAKQVEKLQQLESETDNLSAKIKNAGDQMDALGFSTDMTSALTEATQSVDLFEAALQESESRLEKVDAALKLDPTSVELVQEKTDILAEQMQSAEKEADELQDVLNAFKAKGIDTAGQSMEELQASTQKATEEWNEAEAQCDAYEATLSELTNQQKIYTAQLDSTSDGFAEMKQKMADNEQAIEDTTDALEEWRAKAEQAEDAMDYARMAEEMGQVESASKDVAEKVESIGAAAEQAQADYSNAVKDMKGSNETLWYAVEDLGETIEQMFSNTVREAIESCIEAANDLDTAFRDMKKTVAGTEEEFEELEDAAVEYSQTHVTSAEEILEIEELGGQLGIAADELEEFADVVSNISIATDLDADEAAEDVGELINVLDDLSVDNVEQFSDALVRLGNNGASTESEIADVATRIASTASTMGMTTPEILAWSSTLASTGVSAETAGTALVDTMVDIESAVANESEALDVFAEAAGMSAEEFADAWQNEPSDALEAFIKGLEKMEDSGESSIAKLEELGITSVRQVSSIQNLAGSIDLLDDNLEMSKDAWNGVSDEWGDAGDAASEAEQKSEGLSGAISIIENTLENLAASIGDAFTPMVQDLADWLVDLADWFYDLDDSAKVSATGLLTIVAASGPVLTAVGSMANGAEKISKKLKNLKEKLGNTSSALSNFKEKLQSGEAAASTLANVGVAALLIALGKLVEKLVENYRRAKRYQQASDDLENAIYGVTDATEDEVGWFEKLLGETDEAEEAIDDLYDSISDLADEIDSTNDEMNASIDSIGDAEDAIDSYLGENELTASQLGELTSAVEIMNEACGTSYELARDSSGAWVIVEEGCENITEDAIIARDAIKDLLDSASWEAYVEGTQSNLDSLSTEISTIQEDYADAIVSAEDSYDDLVGYIQDIGLDVDLGIDADEIATQLDDLYDVLDESTVTGFIGGISASEAQQLQDLIDAYQGASDEAGEYEDQLAELEGQSDDLTERLGYAEEAIDGTGLAAEMGADAFSTVINTLQSTGQSYDDFAAQIEQVGIDVSSFADMSTADLTTMLTNWDGTLSSMYLMLDEAGYEMEDGGALLVAQVADGMESGLYGVTTANELLQLAAEGDWSTLIKKMEGYGYEVDETFATAVANGSYTATDATQAVIDDASTNVDTTAAGQHYEQYALELLDSFSAGIENHTDQVDEAMDAINLAVEGNDWSGIISLCEEWGIEIPKVVASGVDNNTFVASDAVSEMLDECEATAENVDSSTLINTGNEIADGIATGMVNGLSLVEAAVDALTTSAGGIVDLFKSAMGIESPSKVMIEWAQYIPAGIQEGIQNGEETYLEGIGAELAEYIMSDELETIPDEVAEIGSQVGTSFAEGISENSDEVRTAVSTAMTSAIAGLSTFGDNMYAVGQNGVDSLASGISESIAATDFGSIVSSAIPATGVSSLNTNMYNTGVTAGGKLASGLSSASSQVRTAGSTLISSAATGVSTLEDKMQTAGTRGGSAFVGAIEDSYSSARTAGKTLADKVTTGMSTFSDDMEEEGGDGSQSFIVAVKSSSKLSAAKSAGTSLASKAVSGAASKNGTGSGTAYEAGQNFAKGFGNGISSKNSWVYNKAYNLAKQAVQAVNDAQDSGSPSKVMAEVGGWFGEGYAEGIVSEYDDIEKAAARAAALAVEAATTDAVSSINYETTAQAATASAVLDAIERLSDNRSNNETAGMVVNQTFETKVVRADSDLYTAAPIIYRNAMREASLV